MSAFKTKNDKLDDFIGKYSKTECDSCGMKFETTKEYANHSKKVSIWSPNSTIFFFFSFVMIVLILTRPRWTND
jgi:uncharacterized C2H2 Zn-finger protein